MRKVLLSLVACVAGVVACSSAVDPVERPVALLVPARSSYVSGETIALEMINRSKAEIAFGACSLRLEQFESNRWTLVGREASVCILIAYVVAPGATTDRQFRLDPGVTPGTYRLREDISSQTHSATVRIYSPQFTVDAGTTVSGR